MQDNVSWLDEVNRSIGNARSINFYQNLLQKINVNVTWNQLTIWQRLTTNQQRLSDANEREGLTIAIFGTECHSSELTSTCHQIAVCMGYLGEVGPHASISHFQKCNRYYDVMILAGNHACHESSVLVSNLDTLLILIISAISLKRSINPD